ncbi:alpha-protein kinase 3 isoform X3 [Brachyhypopomus gauderio]|uniref:alpha-protein kinase 3 isoform X3 n=1 Tax=Brachyhypopomus gauderio TaxID=698409 RepID=UPI0040411E85
MNSRRLLSRSFSEDGRSDNHRTSDRSPGEGNDSLRDTVRPESRNTLYSVLAQLTELTQPMFETTLKSRAVSETTNVKFSCVISGYPAPEVTWYKDDVQLDKYCSLPKYEIINEDKTHSLRIYNCSLEDAAIYQVSARNSQGIVSCSGVLEVGTMNEYMIHQNYFAKLKQKAKSLQRGQEGTRRPDKENVPEVMETVKASSPERVVRKRRSPTDANAPHPAFPPQPEELRDHMETKETTNELHTPPQPSTTSVSAVTHDETFSKGVKCNNGQAIVDHNMINVAKLTSNRMPDKELFVNNKKIKISAEGGERGSEDKQVERELGRKKETQRGKDRNLPKATMSLLPSEEQMEIDSKVNQAKAISELRGTIKEVKPELRKYGFSEKRTEMGPPNRSKSTTKPPAPQKQPMVKISTVTKTETTTRPIWLKKPTRVKKENTVSAVPSHAPSHLPDVTPQSRTVNQPLTNKDQIDIEGTGPSRPGDPLSSEPARGDTRQASSRTPVVSREYIEAPGGLNSGLTKEQALFENVMIQPQTEGRITLVKDTSGRNVSIPYTTSTAATDHMPVHMETAPCDNSPPYHRETSRELKPQLSNEVTDDNTGKPSAYKHIKNNKHRQNVVQLPIGSEKGSTHPGTDHRQKVQELSMQVDKIPPGQSSHTQQGQAISVMDTSEPDAKKKDQKLGSRKTEERNKQILNKSTLPAADALTKSQQHEADVCVTQIANNEAIIVNTRKETEDTFKIKEHLVPNVFDACQVTVAESQLHNTSNVLNPGTLQLQTPESSPHSSQSEQPTDIQECKKTSAPPIPAVDKNERAAPGNRSWEYEEKLLVENDFEKTGNEACFPPVSPAPAGKPPKPGALASSKLLSACLETLIPMIYVTDMDSAQENDSADATTHTSPDFKNRNKSAESSVANGSFTTNEETNSIFNQTGEIGKQTDTVITDSAPLTAKTLPVMVSAPLNLNLSEANGAYEGDEKRTKDSFTAPSSQSADTAGSGPVTDNNTPSFADGSTTTKLTGTAETTNITSLVMQNFTRLNLGSECPASSQESNHVTPPAPDAACLTHYLKEAALELEDESDTAPKSGEHVGTEETVAAPQKNTSTQAKGGESNEQVAGDTEVKKEAPQRGTLSPQQGLSTLQAQSPTERISSELIHQDQEPVKGSEQRPENLNASDWAESAATDKQNQLKAPQVISKIRQETCDASRNMKLWCQFFNVLSDSTLTWYKDDVEIAEMKRSAGDESQVSLAVVQMSERDCGLYRCTITNEYGTDFTDYLLATESISSLVLRKTSAEVGEEVEMTALLFGKGLPDTGYWSNTFFGRILREETQLGMGCEHKTSRSKVIYGLDPVFDSGSSCLIKVRSPIAYRGREDISLAERNIQMTKQACKIQNLSREYCKVFSAQTRLIENFGPELDKQRPLCHSRGGA